MARLFLTLLVIIAAAASASAVSTSHLRRSFVPPPSVAAAPPTSQQEDCQLRAMALEFVNYLELPDTTGDWVGSAYWALQLPRCNTTLDELKRSFTTPAISAAQQLQALYPHHDVHPLPSPARSDADCGWEVFVDGSIGDDANVGSVAQPLSSIHQALTLSRTVRRSASSSTSRVACITIRAGTYYLGVNASSLRTDYDSRVGAIALGPADSGLTIRAYKGENVTLSGGVSLQSLQWQKWKNQVLVAPLDSASIPALDRWHFNSLYIDGKRAVTAKYPNGDPAVNGLWNHAGWITSAQDWVAPRPVPPAVVIRVSEPQRAGTHFPQYLMGIGGPAAVFDPPQSFWSFDNPGGGAFQVPSGVVYGAELSQRVANWSNPSTGQVFAFHDGHWGSWAFDIRSVNTTAKAVLFGRGGHQEARGSGGGAEYYFSNILEELDDGSEFFIDYTGTGSLYFQPNTSMPKLFVASQLPCILSVTGTQSHPVTNVEIDGLTFAHTASTFMRPYEVPSGGDWSVHRGGAVYLEGTRFTAVTRSTFSQLAGNAIVVSNYNEAVDIAWNEFSWLGESGVVIIGQVSGIDGVSNTNVPRYTNVIGNLFTELGAFIKQTAGVVHFLSSQSFIAQNAIFNVPRAGINVNDGYHGGTSIVANAFFNTVRETGDHGPINSWDRIPYLVDTGNGPTLRPLTNIIARNLLFNNYASVWPIDHDDGSAYYEDSYNVLVYGGYKNYLGHSKTAHHHLYIYPDGQRFDSLPAFFTRQQEQRASKYGKSSSPNGGWGAYCAQYFSPQVNDSGWGEQYFDNACVLQQSPEPYDIGNCDVNQSAIIPNTFNNTYYFPAGVSFQVSCSSSTLNLTQWQQAGYDANTVQLTAPPLSDTIELARQTLGFSRQPTLTALTAAR